LQNILAGLLAQRKEPKKSLRQIELGKDTKKDDKRDLIEPAKELVKQIGDNYKSKASDSNRMITDHSIIGEGRLTSPRAYGEKKLKEASNKSIYEPDLNREIKETVTRIMRELAGKPTLDPETVTLRKLKIMKLDDPTCKQIMKLKDIYDEVKNNKYVDSDEIKRKIDAVIAEITKGNQTGDSPIEMIKILKNDLEKMRVVDAKEREKIQNITEKVAQNMLQDNKFKLGNVDTAKLRKLKTDPKTIDLVNELSGLWKLAQSGDKNAKKYKEKVQEIIEKLEKNTLKKEASQRFVEKIDEELAADIDEKNRLEELMKLLNKPGKISGKQEEYIKQEIVSIIREMLPDENADISKLNKRLLERKYKLSPEKIEEVMNLLKIYNEVKDGKPVDAAHIKEELEVVVHEIEEEIKSLRSHKEIIKETAPEKMDNIVDELKDLEEMEPEYVDGEWDFYNI